MADSQISLRDYFAAHAPEPPTDFPRSRVPTAEAGNDLARIETDGEWIARWRWHYADLMLKARDA